MPDNSTNHIFQDYLAGRAWKQNYDKNQQDMQEQALDIKAKQLATMAQENVTSAIAAAGPGLLDKPPAEALNQLADIMVSNGQVDAGGVMWGRAALATSHESDAKVKEYEGYLQTSRTLSVYAAGIKDSASLQQAAQMAAVQGLDPKGILRSIVSADQQHGWEVASAMLKQLQTSLVSVREQSQIELDKARADKEKAIQSMYEKRRDVLIPAQAREADARAKAHTKAGGIKTQTMGRAFTYAKSLIEDKYLMEAEDGSSLSDLSSSLATETSERAQEMMAAQPTLPWQAAVRMAFAELQTAPSLPFAGLSVKAPDSGTRGSPLELPSDPKQLQLNKVYKGKGKFFGQLRLWNGSGFVRVPSQAESSVYDEVED